MRSFFPLLLVAVLLTAACDQKIGTPAEEPGEAPREAPKEARFPYPDDPEMKKRAPDVFKVRFVTSKGDFVVEAHRPWAPHGVDRLYNLVRHGFYDDTRIFRVIPGFVAQFGISGDPAISLDWFDAGFPDDPVRQKNLKGTVTFAKTGLPHSRTTQLFVNLGDNSSSLDLKGFAPVGKVIEGLPIVEDLRSTQPDADPMGRTPDQGRLKGLGNRYLDSTFPKLCRILSAKVEK